jgi:NAD(P)-dependent dehydrogenase (short-subunit alcohol dehydrogenase family)
LINEFGSSRIQRIQANLGVEEDVLRLFGSFDEQHFGPVQVAIVNHAQAFPDDVPVSRITLDQWNYTMNANLTSSFLVVREFLKGLESADEKSKDKAAIVFIGSTAGKYGEAGNADYAATKSGTCSSF